MQLKEVTNVPLDEWRKQTSDKLDAIRTTAEQIDVRLDELEW
jgi:hypothetical protein